MWQFDEFAAQFPPPRTEEPVNLRREIIEELTDHLTCARRREQMAGDEQTEEAVRRRVLERFGDPASVARKLWLDWMWERIMTQRILVATCVLMVALSCVALGLAWASLKGQQDIIATWQSTSDTQMRDQQKLFERLIAQSEKALAQRSVGSTESIEWNPVEIKLVAGKEDGPPLAGITAKLSSSVEGSNIPQLSGISDDRGIVRFERVHFGNYNLRVTTPSDESLYTSLIQHPGKGSSKTIVCPYPPNEPTRVTAQVNWPDELPTRHLWLRLDTGNVDRSVGSHKWGGQKLLPGADFRSILFEPSGSVYSPDNRTAARHEYYQTWKLGHGGITRQRSPLPVVLWNQFAGERTEVVPDGMMWPGRDYKIRELEVLITMPAIATMEELRRQVQDRDGNRLRRPDNFFEEQQFFFALQLGSADWPHAVEPGTAEKPGMLRLTPTDEAVAKVRDALAEIEKARETAEKSQAEYEKFRAERLPRLKAAAEGGEKKDSADTK